MPNWCYQTLEITGEPKQLNKLLKKIEVTKSEATDNEPETPFSFNNVIPMPPQYHLSQAWYEWRVTNWGTKWQPQINVANVDEWESGSIYFDFDTAWSPPYPIIEALSKEFKKLEFHWRYWEESYEYWGVHNLKKGKEVKYEGGAFKSCDDYTQFGLDHHWCELCSEHLECEGEATTSLCEVCEQSVIEADKELWDTTTTEGEATNGREALLS
jgi:hypothetical protein